MRSMPVFAMLLVAVSACKKNPFVSDWEKVQVANNANFPVYVVPGYGPSWWMNAYPDVNLPSNRPNLTRIGANSQDAIYSGKDWQEIFDEMPKDTLSFYFFNADTVDALPWSEVQSRYLVLLRKDYTFTTLTEAGFSLTYP
ncbi:MAG: hypothetical protein QM642_08145 [Edaphocola sp.]